MDYIKFKIMGNIVYFELQDDPLKYNLEYDYEDKTYAFILDYHNCSLHDNYLFPDLNSMPDDELFNLSLEVDYNVYLIKEIQQFCKIQNFEILVKYHYFYIQDFKDVLC